MSTVMPSSYAGDQAFEALLHEVQCPMPLQEIKPFILGCLAATEVPKVDTILSILWGGDVPPFDGLDQLNRFIGQFFALWNDMAVRLDNPSFPLTSAAPIESLADVQRHVTLRQAEVTAFLRGLDAGSTHVSQLSAEGQRAMDALGTNLHFWSEFDRLIREKPTEGADSVNETAANLRQLDYITGDAIWTVVGEQRRARLQEMQGGRPQVRAAKPGRNDPCPCGSGKKYKQCCGR